MKQYFQNLALYLLRKLKKYGIMDMDMEACGPVFQ